MIVAACLMVEVTILIWPEQKTEADGWHRRLQTPEIAGPATLVQRFTVTGPDLSALTFFAHPAGPSVAGGVDLDLVELRRDDRRVMAHQRVPAQTVVAAGAYTYRFPAIADSRNHTYQFTISAPDVAPGHGITVDVIRHQYGGDNPPNILVFGGREQYGSLRFTTEIDSRTMLRRTVDYLKDEALGPFSAGAFAIAWVLLHFLAVQAIFAMRYAYR